MAPEVAMDVREKIDERADLYSMAIAMYYCLTGHQPFCERAVAGGDAARLADIVRKEAELTVPPSKLRSDVPKDMDKMIMGLISKDAGGRAHRKASSLLNSIYERWPEACAAMPPEGASSLVSLDGE
jgi:serine/threonine protein kinase